MSKIYYAIAMLFFVAIVSVPALGQKGSLKGKVVNMQTGGNIPGATVQLVEIPVKKLSMRLGAISRKDGEFSISGIEPGNYRLSVKYIGFKNFNDKLEIKAGDNPGIEIKLIEDVIGLDEIVVTGVASRREKAVSDVSVARIDAAELQENNNYVDLGQVLTGKISGVQVQTSSGNIGGGMRFQVRGGGGLNGNGQPVIFVDGARISNDEIGTDIGGQFVGSLADLNPEDIAKVEILKGPAGAGLYGTSGSNGVVLITTKRGAAGKDFFKLNYKGVTGWNEAANEYGEDEFYSYQDANNMFQEGPIEEHNISVSGKSGIFNYYAGYTVRDEEGIVFQNNYTRESVRANFEVVPSNEVSLKFSSNYVWSDNQRPYNDNNVLGWLGNTLLFPTSYIFTDSMAIANLDNMIKTYRFIGSAEFNYLPNWLPGLKFYALLGYDGLNYRNDVFYPPGYRYTGPGTIGEKSIFVRARDLFNYHMNVSYDYMFTDKFKSTTLLGTQMFSNTTKFVNTDHQGFASEKLTNLLAADEHLLSNDGLSDFREAGIYLQEDLAFDDTYFLTLAVRNDFSSVVGIDAPNILYPRISGAVRLDKLNITPDMMNFLKLRFGYGQSGQLPGLYAATPLLWAGGASGHGVGYILSSIGNIAIEPERINEFEIGFETEIYNAYGIDFTYYQQNATESIIPFPNPPSTGLIASSVPTNVGEIEIWGFETMIYASPVITEDFRLDFNLILNQQDNKIIDLGSDQPIIGGFGNQGWREGYSRSAFYERKVNGALFDDGGNFAGVDVESDMSYLGTPLPTFTGSFTTGFTFLKNFHLSFMFEWATGQHVYNNTRAFQIAFGNDVEFTNIENDLFGYTDDNGDPVAPLFDPGTAGYKDLADKYAKLNPNYDANFIQEADWLRLREISFRVNATKWLQSLLGEHVKSINIGASVRNAILWTVYDGKDPEVNMFGSRSQYGRGVDFLTLMNPRTFNFFVNIGL